MTSTHMMFSCIFIFLSLVQIVYMQRYVGDSCVVNFNKQRGVCRLVTECDEARKQYDQFRVRPTRCGFEGSTPIVCCGESAPLRQPPPPNVNTNNRQRVSERKCELYSQSVTSVVAALPLLVDAEPISNTVVNCEYGSTELIVGGQPVKLGEFPHMAAIGWELNGGRGYEWNCGGTLISEDFVLTAAHCLYLDGTEYANDGEPNMVRLGEFDLSSTADDGNVQNIKIENSISHPNYKVPEKYNDIALLKLQRSATLGKFVRPACLWTKSTVNEKRAIATGWGLISQDGDKSNVLLRVSLDIMDQPSCSRIFGGGNRRSLPNGIIETQFCSGVKEGGKDTCRGDSGGPLQVQSKSNPCIFNLIGLTSFGKKCGQANSGGVYTKISSYVDWIERSVWPNER